MGTTAAQPATSTPLDAPLPAAASRTSRTARQADPVQEFFSIGEVCALTDLRPHVLRYWETQFRALRPAKNRSGNRVYARRVQSNPSTCGFSARTTTASSPRASRS
jgi:hypothetical protein